MLVSRFPRNSDFFHVCSGRLVSYVYTRNGPRDCRGGASCHPGLRWRSSASDHVLGDRRLGDLEPKLQQFAMIRRPLHNGFFSLIRRIRSRNARSIFGRPVPFCDFQRQNAVKPNATEGWSPVEPPGSRRASSAKAGSARPAGPGHRRAVEDEAALASRRCGVDDEEAGYKPAPRLE